MKLLNTPESLLKLKSFLETSGLKISKVFALKFLHSVDLKIMSCLTIELFQRPVIGVLRSTLHGYWSYEAVVDSWPNVKALVLRPCKNIEVMEFLFF